MASGEVIIRRVQYGLCIPRVNFTRINLGFNYLNEIVLKYGHDERDCLESKLPPLISIEMLRRLREKGKRFWAQT